MLIGFALILAEILLQRVFRAFSFSPKPDMVSVMRDSEGSGVLDRLSAKEAGSARLGGWIGAGRSGVSGKKTELKLVDGDVGVPGDRGLEVFSSKGDEVLGKVSKGGFRSWLGKVDS